MHDLIIVGGGPGGLTAALYAARARLDVLLLEKGAPGGQVLLTEHVDNYPGFPEGVGGFDLAERMTAQIRRFGVEPMIAAVVSMDLAGPVKSIRLEGGSVVQGRAVILATGARPNSLHVPGERELNGKGVSYCATCDGPFYRGQEIAVVGGGDTAVEEAIYLTRFASKVTIIHRRDELRAVGVIQEEAFANEKIHFLCETRVTAIEGTDGVEALRLAHADGSSSRLPVQGVFILIGSTPNHEMLPLDQLRHEQGFVMTDDRMRTNLPGVYAVGDLRAGSVRQIVSAAGDGAVAEKEAEAYLENLHRQAASRPVRRRKCTEARKP